MATLFWVCANPTCSDGEIIGQASEISVGKALIISRDIRGIPLRDPKEIGIIEEIVQVSTADYDYAVKLADKTVLWLQKTAG